MFLDAGLQTPIYHQRISVSVAHRLTTGRRLVEPFDAAAEKSLVYGMASSVQSP
jgi:hypothetical protein